MNRVNREFLRQLKSRLRFLKNNLAENKKNEKIFERSIRPVLQKIENDRAKAYGDEKKYLLAELAKAEEQIQKFLAEKEEKKNENQN